MVFKYNCKICPCYKQLNNKTIKYAFLTFTRIRLAVSSKNMLKDMNLNLKTLFFKIRIMETHLFFNLMYSKLRNSFDVLLIINILVSRTPNKLRRQLQIQLKQIRSVPLAKNTMVLQIPRLLNASIAVFCGIQLRNSTNLTYGRANQFQNISLILNL